MTIGRRVVNVTQKARGREPIKYELEVIPFTAWDIPPEYDRILFAWERGSKLFVTDAEEVRPNRSVVWKQFLKQTATMYKSADGFEPKDFSFKLQSVKKNSKGVEDRKTVAKIHVDLSTYCTGQVNPQPVEKTFTLKPFGKLKVSIKASWLKDAKVDYDAMTEATGTSFGRSNGDYEEFEGEEQDLTGFNHEEFHGEDGEESGGPSVSKRSSRSSRKGKSRIKSRQTMPDDDAIPEGLEEAEEDPRPREKRRNKDSRPRLQYHGEEGQQLDANGNQVQPADLGMGMQVKKQTWKDVLCCCLQPKVVAPPTQVQEEVELLSKPQRTRRSDR